MDQMRETAKLKGMMRSPDYCLQLFLAALRGQTGRPLGPTHKRRRIRSARNYRLAAWRSPGAPSTLRRIPRHGPPRT